MSQTNDTKLQKYVKAIPLFAMQALMGEIRYSSYSFSTSALDEVSGQRHAPAVLYAWEWTPGIHRIGGWMGLRAGMDTEAGGKILYLRQASNPGRPVCSQTLYWLSYPSSLLTCCINACCHSMTLLPFVLAAVVFCYWCDIHSEWKHRKMWEHYFGTSCKSH
jgi:hypothetical protein